MSRMVTKMMSMSPGIPPASQVTTSPQPPQQQPASSPSTLAVRTIPGSYGWPLLGPISDRLNYFWFQGPEKFFKTRSEKHKSTVFRTNVPPSFPFFTNVNPNVIAVVDCKSFAHLFDMELVEKRDVLVGDFMPSVKFTGGTRVCAYLDTTETSHSKVKNFTIDILKRSSGVWATALLTNLESMWDTLEADLSMENTTSVSYIVPLQKFLLKFLSKALLGADVASSPKIAESGYLMLDKWLAFQLLPTVHIGVLQPLEELFLHSFSYPFALVSSDYKKLYEFVEKEGKDVVERGKNEFGLSQEDTIHNLIFVLGFNAFGGFSVFLPSLLSRIGSDSSLQQRLRNEVRSSVCESLTSFNSIKDMELVQSVVYETLRLSPPVPLQYGRARKDFVLSSHDSDFEVKKGELLCGYQKQAMVDPKVFDDPDSFVPDRFVGQKGRELLNYLYWSNGPQTGSSTESNKQCAAKDVVPLTACLLVAYVFSRYDSVTCGSSSITAIEKAK